MRTRTIYIAPDETEFAAEDECLEYERAHPEFALVGLTLAQLRSALEGGDSELASAIALCSSRLFTNDPHEQGRRDFLAGAHGVIPQRFVKDKEAGEAWLTGWDGASKAAYARAA